MLTISFFSKRFQRFKGKSRFKEFHTVENLALAGKFDEALKEIDSLDSQGILQENMRLYSQFLKSNIYICKNEYEKGLIITEDLLKENLDLEIPFFQIDILISKANACLALGNFNSCFDAIKVAETLLGRIEQPKKDIATKLIALNNLKSQLLMKKGNFDLALETLRSSNSIQDNFLNPIQLGNIYAGQGEYEVAIQLLQENRTKFKELEDKCPIIRLNNNLGLIYAHIGELDLALELLQSNTKLIEEFGNEYISSAHLNNLGIINLYKGDISLAFNYFEKSLTKFKDLACKYDIAITQNNLGSSHAIRGELEQSLKYYEESLAYFNEIENKHTISMVKANIGNVRHQLRVRVGESVSYYENSLKLLETGGNPLDLSLILLNLVSINCYSGLIQESKQYFEMLQEICQTNPSKITNQINRLANALILKASGRVVKKAEAGLIFAEIVKEEVLREEITILAIKNSCDLLFQEFRDSGSIEVLNEIKTTLDDLLTKGERQESFSLLIETYLLQSKIALLELDLNTARRLLSKAQQVSEEKAPHFGLRIASDYDTLLDQSEKWKDFTDRTIAQRLEMAELENRVTKLIQKKAEVSALANEAPILFLILGRSGMSIFSKHFADDSLISEQLIGGFLTAINAFTEHAFSQEGTIEGIKHKEHTILLVPVESFLCCYIFKGSSYFALKKLTALAETLKISEVIKDRLTEASHLGLEISGEQMIQNFVDGVFLSSEASPINISPQAISSSFYSQNVTISINYGIYFDPEISYLKEYL